MRSDYTKGADEGKVRIPLLPLGEKVDRRVSAETDEGCSSGVKRRRSLEHPSSGRFAATFSHKEAFARETHQLGGGLVTALKGRRDFFRRLFVGLSSV